jgi:Flp pilus assembly protein TadD
MSMSWRNWAAIGLLTISAGSQRLSYAGDIKITIPRRSHLTPVQKLNREGVEAARKHSYKKAEGLFYKAYLLDPDDPFTLNNLGFVSELQGQIDRADHFYKLAAQQSTDAVIDEASVKRNHGRAQGQVTTGDSIEGESFNQAFGQPHGPLEVNHNNGEALRLLAQKRAPEADLLLRETLKTDPRNVFTLNNMGVAKEMEGESQEALKYYDAAAATHSDAAAIVTLNHSWRGKPASEMAAQNAKRLRNRLDKHDSLAVELAELNLRGVYALNRNDLSAAKTNFRAAYALDPNNAFALNNIGYVSEIEGDRETAQMFYDKAQTAADANAAVGLATRPSAQGMKLFRVAEESDSQVESKVAQERESLRREHKPILLKRRDNSVVEEPATPPASPSQPAQVPPSN